MAGDLDRAVPGGEDGHAFRARYDAAVAAVVDAHGPDATAVVFSHGAAIRAYAALAARLTVEESHELWLANTGLAASSATPRRAGGSTAGTPSRSAAAPCSTRAAHDVTGEDVHGDAEGEARWPDQQPVRPRPRPPASGRLRVFGAGSAGTYRLAGGQR